MLFFATILAAFTPALADDKVELRELSLSTNYWVEGMILHLTVDLSSRPVSEKNKPLLSKEWKPVIRRNGQIVPHQSQRRPRSDGPTLLRASGRYEEGSRVWFDLEAALSAVPGQYEVFLEKGAERVGPLPLQVLGFVAPSLNASPDEMEKVFAVIVTNLGSMLVEFYPRKAPETVRNFYKLAIKDFYNGSKFHRILKGFMIQGGDPKGDGTGGAGYTIKAEFNDIPHVKGVLSMAREEGKPDSASCQFFIVHGDKVSHLDRQYTAFGKLLDGYDTLDKIASVPTVLGGDGQESRPKDLVVIKRIILVEKPQKETRGK